MRGWIWAGVALLALPVQAEDPWADEVIALQDSGCNTGFCTPEKAVGAPVGGGLSQAGLSSLHSVGTAGSYITLKFNAPVTDDAANPMGLDFIVFGNGHWVAGNPQQRWMEPGAVEISADANHNGIADDPWYLIPGSRGIVSGQLASGIANPTPPMAGGGGVTNPNSTDTGSANDNEEYDWGYADMNPVDAPYADNYLRPDDPFEVGLSEGSGGGDAFDIAWAVDGAGQPAQLQEFSFIRIHTLVQGNAVGPITTEIDAVADVPPAVDSDGDGVLDEYEARVAGTDPAREGSTVLPLEIPLSMGGSATAGTLLGLAADGEGHSLALRSSGLRSGSRAFNATVDIHPQADPGGSIPGKIKSGMILEFECSIPDFAGAQVADGEFTIHYSGASIAGLYEAGLQPWRYSNGSWTREGISGISRDMTLNIVTFKSRYPGVFVLASVAGNGDGGGSAAGMPASGFMARLLLVAALGGLALSRMRRGHAR